MKKRPGHFVWWSHASKCMGHNTQWRTWLSFPFFLPKRLWKRQSSWLRERALEPGAIVSTSSWCLAIVKSCSLLLMGVCMCGVGGIFWSRTIAWLKGVVTLQQPSDITIFHLGSLLLGYAFKVRQRWKKVFPSRKTGCVTNGPKSQRKFLTQPAFSVLSLCTSEQHDECISSKKWENAGEGSYQEKLRQSHFELNVALWKSAYWSM